MFLLSFFFQFVLVILTIIHCSHGNKPYLAPSEKFKLSAEPGYFRPNSNLNYKEKTNPLIPDIKDRHASERKDGDSNVDFYKPLTSFQPYGPSEEDSKYIPHSKIFSKYIISKKNPSFDIKLDLEDKEDEDDQDEDKKESDEIPRYGFAREKSNDDLPKDYSNENDEDVPLKHHDNKLDKKYQNSFDHKSSSEQHSKEKSNGYKLPEYHHTPHDTYPEQNNEYRHHEYPEHEKKHRHPYPEYKEEHRHPYSEYKEENRHVHPEYKEEHRHVYPEYKEEHTHHGYSNDKEEHDYPHNIDSKENHEHHHYPEYKREYGHDHYPDHKESHGHHSYSNVKEEYGGHHHPNHKEEYAKYVGKHEEDEDKHHNLDFNEDKNVKHHQYHHSGDRHYQTSPESNSGKSHKEIGSRKPYMPKHHTLLEDKFSHVPRINDFIKQHKLDFPKILHEMNGDKLHHKKHEHVDDTKNYHYASKHYPYLNKYHKGHQFKSFLNSKPFFNVGGHSYSGMYKPKVDIYQQLRKDLDLKMRLLKEHEEKLAELQRGHLQKYRALFQPTHAKKYFNYELPTSIIPNRSKKYHSHSEFGNEKDGHDNSPKKHHQTQHYPDVLKFTENKSKHYLPRHHDSHHPKYEATNEEHYSHDSHLDKKEYAPKKQKY